MCDYYIATTRLLPRVTNLTIARLDRSASTIKSTILHIGWAY